MATSPSSFTLDRGIFNSTLYSHLRGFWFSALPDDAATSNEESDKMWFRQGSTEGENAAFDAQCRDNYAHALESIGPEKLALPPFESHEVDVEQASTLAKPFFEEVEQALGRDEREGADTLISLLLLLDQIPRNIYRDPASLRLVFTHYDRLSISLLRASMKLKPNPLDAECYRLRPAVKQWYLIPLMHSEHLPSHEMYVDLATRARTELEAVGLQEAVQQIDRLLAFENMHMEPMRKFGRYPHRNHALGRTNTKEEAEYLKSGPTFGTAQAGEEDGGKSSEKSEL